MKRYHIHGAIALLSLTTLVYELSLMRVFSVTVWYYFAFFVISLALLGFGAAATLIFVFRDFFRRHLSSIIPGAALLFGLFAAVSPLIYLNLDLRLILDSTGYLNMAFTLLLFLLPFFFVGIVIAGIFSVYSKQIGTLYWADLTGASLGCILVIPLLYLIPAPNLLVWVGIPPIIAAYLLKKEITEKNNKRDKITLPRGFKIQASAAGILVLALSLSGFFSSNPYTVRFSKVIHETEKPIYTSWNAFSRLTVYDDIFWREEVEKPFGWGMSPAFSGSDIKQYWIDQDDCAGTPITNFDGDFTKLDFLSYDVTNIAYQYREYDDALIVGPGGGRDILAAKYFGVESVTAVEINPAMIETVEEVFGDFSGHPYQLPGVESVVDEARSYIARDTKQYDIIMISLIDSWAASMAGAFALAENNLYTVEAFELYLDHLRQDGVLTVSRWYHGSRRAEALRLINLCAVTLERMGVQNPGRHIAVIQGDRIATVITSKRPFTEKELDEIQNAADRLQFNTVWIPGQVSVDDGIDALLTSRERGSYVASLPIDIRAPVDDRPFFFLIHSSILEDPPEEIPGELTFSTDATLTLQYLFYILLFACLIFIILPLSLQRKGKHNLLNVLARPHKWLYFAGIGLGFMLVELSLIQRYVLLLGHPAYATSVVIFSLLLFAGLGSATTNRLKKRYPLRGLNLVVFAAIGIGILIQAFAVPWLLTKAMPALLIWRFLITGVLLAPLGFVMGMAFPLGISRLNEADSGGMIPYVWGINSVMSVLATVVATVIAVGSGYTTGLMAGFAAYALAALTCAFKWRKKLIAEKA